MNNLFIAFAVAFNLKGTFKQRFYHKKYMVASLVSYYLFNAYFIYSVELSDMLPFTRAFNEWFLDTMNVSYK